MTPLVKAGGTAIVLLCSDENDAAIWEASAEAMLPRRMSQGHLRKMWSDAGWDIDNIESVDFQINQRAAASAPSWLQIPPVAAIVKRGAAKAYLMTATKRGGAPTTPAMPSKR